MISRELKVIIKELKKQGKMAFEEGAMDSSIEAEESFDHFLYPSKFKEWLRFSDGGEFFLPAGIQLYGVSHLPPIDLVYDDRPDDTYIVIGALSTGDPILCKKTGGEEISIYNHDAGRIEEDEVYPDFFSFLKELPAILGIGGKSSMSARTSVASKAVREAWENERQLVLEGKGTRDWTPEEQQYIIEKGKAYDYFFRTFEGHHMKSAEAYPEYQGDPANIQFLTRDEHKNAHGGNFKNPTNGAFDPETGNAKSFGNRTYVSYENKELSEPIRRTQQKDENNVAQEGAQDAPQGTNPTPNNSIINKAFKGIKTACKFVWKNKGLIALESVVVADKLSDAYLKLTNSGGSSISDTETRE